MQSGANPNQEIHDIVSRFQAWSGKASDNGHGKGKQKPGADEEVREIGYDEAVRRYRSRQATQKAGTASPASVELAKRVQGMVSSQNAAAEANADPTAERNTPATTLALNQPGGEKKIAAADTKSQPFAPPHASAPVRAKAAAKINKTRPTAARNASSGKFAQSAAQPAAPVAVQTKTAPNRKSAARPGKLTIAALPKAALPTAEATTRKRTPFRDVLVKAAAVHTAPERNTRISVRFSAGEEKQLRQSATAAGMTISAFLRSRALVSPEGAVKTPLVDEAVGRLAQLTTLNSGGSPALASPVATRGFQGLRNWFAGWRNHVRRNPTE